MHPLPVFFLAIPLVANTPSEVRLHFTDVTAEANLLIPPDARAG
jgi:hypothetical protein